MKILNSLIAVLTLINLTAQIDSVSFVNRSHLEIDENRLYAFGYEIDAIQDFNNDGTKDVIFNSRNIIINSLDSTYSYIGLIRENTIDSLIPLDHPVIDSLVQQSTFQLQFIDTNDLDGNGTRDIIGIVTYFLNTNKGDTKIISVLMEEGGKIKDVIEIKEEELGVPEGFALFNNIENLGDLDNDESEEIVFSTYFEEFGHPGALYIASFNENGKINKSTYIENTYIPDTDQGTYDFGQELKGGTDFDGDGVNDLVMGIAHWGESGGIAIFLMNEDLTIKDMKAIRDNGLVANYIDLEGDEHFGQSIAILGNIDNKPGVELLVSENWNEEPIEHSGITYIISLDEFANFKKLALWHTSNDPILNLIEHEHLGYFMDVIDDLNNDGFPEVVMASALDSLGSEAGSIRIISSDFENINNITTDVEDINSKEKWVHIFPNPASSTLFFKDNIVPFADLNIYNLNGEKIYTKSKFGFEPLDINFIGNGIYILEFDTGKAIQRFKIVKNNQ